MQIPMPTSLLPATVATRGASPSTIALPASGDSFRDVLERLQSETHGRGAGHEGVADETTDSQAVPLASDESDFADGNESLEPEGEGDGNIQLGRSGQADEAEPVSVEPQSVKSQSVESVADDALTDTDADHDQASDLGAATFATARRRKADHSYPDRNPTGQITGPERDTRPPKKQDAPDVPAGVQWAAFRSGRLASTAVTGQDKWQEQPAKAQDVVKVELPRLPAPDPEAEPVRWIGAQQEVIAPSLVKTPPQPSAVETAQKSTTAEAEQLLPPRLGAKTAATTAPSPNRAMAVASDAGQLRPQRLSERGDTPGPTVRPDSQGPRGRSETQNAASLRPIKGVRQDSPAQSQAHRNQPVFADHAHISRPSKSTEPAKSAVAGQRGIPVQMAELQPEPTLVPTRAPSISVKQGRELANTPRTAPEVGKTATETAQWAFAPKPGKPAAPVARTDPREQSRDSSPRNPVREHSASSHAMPVRNVAPDSAMQSELPQTAPRGQQSEQAAVAVGTPNRAIGSARTPASEVWVTRQAPTGSSEIPTPMVQSRTPNPPVVTPVNPSEPTAKLHVEVEPRPNAPKIAASNTVEPQGDRDRSLGLGQGQEKGIRLVNDRDALPPRTPQEPLKPHAGKPYHERIPRAPQPAEVEGKPMTRGTEAEVRDVALNADRQDRGAPAAPHRTASADRVSRTSMAVAQNAEPDPNVEKLSRSRVTRNQPEPSDRAAHDLRKAETGPSDLPPKTRQAPTGSVVPTQTPVSDSPWRQPRRRPEEAKSEPAALLSTGSMARTEASPRPELAQPVTPHPPPARGPRATERAAARADPPPMTGSASRTRIAHRPIQPTAPKPDVALLPKPLFGTEISPVEVDRLEPALSQDVRGPDVTQRSPGHQAQVDVSRHVGRQMADALAKPGERPVEISLSPAELGRVRLNMHTTEQSVAVTITAERPETLDLMRRHIDQLSQEFKSLGFSDINFSFQGGQSDHSGTDDGPDSGGPGRRAAGPTDADAGTPPSNTGPGRAGMVPAEGLDLRL